MIGDLSQFNPYADAVVPATPVAEPESPLGEAPASETFGFITAYGYLVEGHSLSRKAWRGRGESRLSIDDRGIVSVHLEPADMRAKTTLTGADLMADDWFLDD